MATIPSPTNGVWDVSLFNDFGGGFDVLPSNIKVIHGMRRVETSTPASAARVDIVRAERSTPGSAVRVDE